VDLEVASSLIHPPSVVATMPAPHQQLDGQYRVSNEVQYYADQQYSQGHDQGEIVYGQHYEEYQTDGMYEGQYAHQPETEEYSGIPTEMILSQLCANAHGPRDSTEKAKEEADFSWEPVRNWIRNHSEGDLREAAQQRGHHIMTALHVACRNAPPLDVIDCLLIAAGETAECQDSVGCLPLHYACGFSASYPVIKTLVDIFPESKTMVDVQGKTPLHYAMKTSNSDPSWAAVVLLLSSNGAARIADKEGMLVGFFPFSLLFPSDVTTST
jgi:Ankyrin repeats (3 copies)